MSFLILISGATALSWLLARLAGVRLDLRTAMRCGMGLGFVFTGVDHFVNAELRYLPMIPEFLAGQGLFWVHFTGAAELAGGLAFLVPARRLGALRVPWLHRLAGAGLALLLVCVVVANVHVAQQGQQVQGLPFGAWYYWVRPFFQPVFVAWALYSGGVWSGVWPGSARARLQRAPGIR